ncbi:MAG TPA: methyltransferase domain-containing protein [Gammaproteobacteria bacterium]|nr:methyltransferase domain-containing protein [Gammaproteobacteria bacterium]
MSSPRRSSTTLSAYRRLRQWYLRPLGQLLADREQQALHEFLPTLFGYHLLVVDPPWERLALEGSRIRHRVLMRGEPDADAGLLGTPEALPVSTDSVDMLILPHVLELADNPHEVLREADRCLIPEGHLAVLGFNPLSCWGVWRVLARRRGRLPWSARFISVSRLKDWLALLGFDTLAVRPVLFRPPLQRQGALERLAWLERLGRRGWPLGAGAYLLLARKRVVGLTPLRPRWRPRRRLLGSGIANPSPRGYGRGA